MAHLSQTLDSKKQILIYLELDPDLGSAPDLSVAFQKLRTPNVAQVVQESILEEVSEQTRVLGDVLDLSVEKSEYLPHCKVCRDGRGAPLLCLLKPPQTQGFHSKFLANTGINKPALLPGFLGKTGLIFWFIFYSTQKEKIWRRLS